MNAAMKYTLIRDGVRNLADVRRMYVQRGVWFHPYHTMFLTGAHTADDIEQTLRVTDAAFRAVNEIADTTHEWRDS